MESVAVPSLFTYRHRRLSDPTRGDCGIYNAV